MDNSTSTYAKSLIYLDHNATTPLSPAALGAMTRIYQQDWGNPGSIEHPRGRRAAESLEYARTQVADSIGARSNEIIFTSGASEANNLAILGCAHFRALHEKKTRIVTIATEHKCVLEAAKHSGLHVDICSVNHDGSIDLEHLESLLDERVALVSAMLVNNETGLVQNLYHISELCQKFDIKFHTDAAQALGKISIDVQNLNVDFLSLSAHKAYGPMGIGALYIRRKPRARLTPQMFGGGQERGLRSGTVALPLAVGFGTAAAESIDLLPTEAERLYALQNNLEQQIETLFPNALLKNKASKRVANTVNVSFQTYHYRTLFDHVSKRFSISSGSACSSARIEPSYVLTAMGIAPKLAQQTLRIGMGRSTQPEHINDFIAHLALLKDL